MPILGRTLCGAPLMFLGIVALMARYTAVLVTVRNHSMVPALHDGDRVLVLRHFPQRWIRKGHIVVVWPWPRPATGPGPFGIGQPFIKRVVALPGETIVTALHDIDSSNQARQFPAHDEAGCRYWHIPPGHCFVRGDHLPGGHDSLTWGPVPFRCILGVAVVSFLPVGHSGDVKTRTMKGASPTRRRFLLA